MVPATIFTVTMPLVGTVTLPLSDLGISRTRLSELGKGNKLWAVPLPPIYVELMRSYLINVR